MILLMYVLILSSTHTFATNTPPSCRSKCGDVDILYPFGIGPKCAINSDFEVICEASKQGEKEKPYLSYLSRYELVDISPDLAQARINMDVAWQCFDGTTNTKGETGIDFYNFDDRSPFLISGTCNKLVSTGCGSLPLVRTQNTPDSEIYTQIWCVATCRHLANDSSISNGTCSDACCQADLPGSVVYVDIDFVNVNVTKFDIATSTPCVYAVITDAAEAFRFNASYVNSQALMGQKMPVVITWGDTEENVTSCSENSYSQYIRGKSGYVCICLGGFEGNPYRKQGCQDINECDNDDYCPNPGKCHNTIGSYYCSCPLGMRLNPNSSQGAICQFNPASITGLVITGGVGVGVVLYLLFRVVFTYKKRLARKQIEKERRKNSTRHYEMISLLQNSSNQDITGKMTVIGIEELEKATNHFGETSIVGKGGHGVVYKGMLLDQTIVAVKKPKINDDKETQEFLNEVVILSQLNHRNVVKLVGCCLESEVPLLVYEFISNGTLTDHLHVKQNDQSLSWSDRLRIALEIARALSYLHSAASISVFHRDIKTSNVLLTDGLTTKLSDFGASRSIEIDKTGVTTIVQGTYGYLDPEYFYSGRLTEKSDVYSFGVILVELLTRKKPYSIADMPNGGSLVAYFNVIMNESRLPEILDPQLLEDEDVAELESVGQIAEMCMKMKGEERPTIKEVELRLEFLWSLKIRSAHHWNAQRAEQQQNLLKNNDQIEEELSRAYSLETELIVSSEFPR